MNLPEFTIGSDPEVFLKDGDNPASAHGLLPGTKEQPHKTVGGAVQVDGMAAEFNTDPCSLTNFETFNRRVAAQLGQIKKMVPDNLSLAITPTQEVDDGYEQLANDGYMQEVAFNEVEGAADWTMENTMSLDSPDPHVFGGAIWLALQLQWHTGATPVVANSCSSSFLPRDAILRNLARQADTIEVAVLLWESDYDTRCSRNTDDAAVQEQAAERLPIGTALVTLSYNDM